MQTLKPLLLAAAVMSPITARAQSLLDRPPNISGNWVGAPGTLYFHFVHRFSTSSAPERKVSNVPTFLVAAGLPLRLLAGFSYSTNSTLAPRFPNEWELFARWSPLAEDTGSPFDLGAHVGYNNAADGVDGEVSVAKRIGPARFILAGRALSNPFEEGNTRFVGAAGATFRLNQYFALAGDVASLTNRDTTERIAWSAGLHLAIPLTPHTFSLHASNAMITTLQGSSRGTNDVRYGFEFTIPLTLRRYFGRREQQTSETDSAVRVVAREDSVVPSAPRERAAAAPPPGAVPPDSAPVGAPPARPASPPGGGRATTPAPPRTTPAPPRTTPAPSRNTTPARTPAQTSEPAATQPAGRVVKTGIKNVGYLQPRLQVQVGTTVEWTNSDPMPHSVTATDKSFDSGLINPGKTYRRTFTKAGTYNFFCIPHPFMKGAIVVRD